MKRLFGLVVFVFFMVSIAFSQTELIDSVLERSVVFDTVMLPPDTLVETQTQIVYVEQEYEMDFLAGLSYGSAYTRWMNSRESSNNQSSFTNSLQTHIKAQFNGYYVKTGVGVELYNRAFESSLENSFTNMEYFQVADTFDVVYAISMGDTIAKYNVNYLLDSVERKQFEDSSVVHVNKYSMLSIPLTVGYSLPLGDFTLNVGGGASAQFVLNEQERLTVFNNELVTENDFIPQFHFNLIGEVDLEYYLPSGMVLHSSIMYKRAVPAFYTIENEKSVYESFCIKAGLSFLF